MPLKMNTAATAKQQKSYRHRSGGESLSNIAGSEVNSVNDIETWNRENDAEISFMAAGTKSSKNTGRGRIMIAAASPCFE
jgi:hypothetical protein